MEVEEYIKEYGSILEKLDTEQVEVAIAIMQEVAKDRRMQEIRDEQKGNDGEATWRQRKYLQSLGVSVPGRLTKREASQMIDEVLNGMQQKAGEQAPVKKRYVKPEIQRSKKRDATIEHERVAE